MEDFSITDALRSVVKTENLVYVGFGMLIYLVFFKQPVQCPPCVCGSSLKA
jgi:hypothetical protein